VRRTHSCIHGDRCFAAAGPKLWNSLLADLRQADISFQRFKRLLKTFLFECWDRGALKLSITVKTVLRFIITYSLTLANAKGIETAHQDQWLRKFFIYRGKTKLPLRRGQEEMWVREATQCYQSTSPVMVRACDKNEWRQANEDSIALGSWREANARTSYYNMEKHRVARCMTHVIWVGKKSWTKQLTGEERLNGDVGLLCPVCAQHGVD